MVTYGCVGDHRCFHLFVTLTPICDHAYLVKDLIIETSQKLGMPFEPGSGGWHQTAKNQEGRRRNRTAYIQVLVDVQSVSTALD